MSMISEQVKEFRDCVHRWQSFENVSSSEPFKLLSQAADTIEALSAKLAANGGGWIACEDRLPEEKGWYLVYAKNQRPFVAYFKGKTFPLNNHYHEIVAWMHLPEPYHP